MRSDAVPGHQSASEDRILVASVLTCLGAEQIAIRLTDVDDVEDELSTWTQQSMSRTEVEVDVIGIEVNEDIEREAEVVCGREEEVEKLSPNEMKTEVLIALACFLAAARKVRLMSVQSSHLQCGARPRATTPSPLPISNPR